MEIYDTYNSKTEVELNKIPQKLQCSFMTNEYTLRGVIIFKLPIVTRKNETNVVGHFTSVSNQNDTWIEYDDWRNKSKKLPANYQANIQVVIYTL